ncbi:homocysteine-responsive endoplasmic reticulum-resident ubiquitin-like domain member 2 protein [Patiria miniata]|uniref:Ubiquitin-like domain-containing protein n=1 Tax=Patiria miniata TaxID=46514 RepID=A0A914B2H5_PATMI|nr:homocysteine-responsive endoplasmic reticulum-resident ubiquitin-like domain member 2 protein [Patiria miniata]XP_038070000.1 homocysteine-responsive endoplasmic reticulum-resident ubiquitin-like domain member 2 protein [Patiria miniata]
MEQLAGNPVTLLIKAPNQKLGDQTVQCFLDWSVQKLKNHLANVYPSKPNEKNQRIIYSGKLLKDNLLLKDVLRLDDKTLQQHTVHLVCSPSPEDLIQSFKPSPVTRQSNPSPSFSPTPSTVPGGSMASTSTEGGTTTPVTAHRRQSTPVEPALPATGGLRHRTVSTPSFSNFYPYSYGNYPMQYGPRGNQPGYMAANHQQQAMWMQQMYAQQMAQYMQYSTQFQAGGAGLNANLPPAHAPVVVPPPQVPDQPGVGVVNPPVAPNVAGPDQNVRMNAGLGPAVDDDDDENVNRDWLDWIYTFCRFSVMLSLVYFYSSLSRFLMVVGFMIFMYLYQKRWFRLQRTPVARERLEDNGNVEQEDREPDNSNQEQPQQDESSERESSTESQEERETDSDSAERPPAPPEPPKPGVLTIAWVFLSTFFTSLFPQDPNVAAAN